MAERRRNHFIPRFLLSRFASRRQGKKTWIWQISRDGRSAEISTRDAAVATDFYGGAETGIEDAFALAEAEFAPLLDAVEKGVPIDQRATELRQLVWTLAVRNRGLREQSVDVLEKLTGKLEGVVATAEFDDLLRSRLTARLPEPGYQEEIEAVIRSGMPKALFDIFREGLQTLGIFDQAAEGGQLKGLANLLATGEAPDSFSPDYWSVYRENGGRSLILGDCCVVATRRGEFCSLVQSNTEWETVYLPISPSTLLVAGRRNVKGLLTFEEINRASAELSSSFFYSPTIDDAVRRLALQIGSKSYLLSQEEVENLTTGDLGSLVDSE